jgi:hypothetical protein
LFNDICHNAQIQSQDSSGNLLTKFGDGIKKTVGGFVDWAKQKLSATLQVNAAYGVGVTGLANFNTSGIDFCGGISHGKGIAGTSTLDYYNGPELKGFTSITTISGGDTFGGYASMMVTGNGVGYGGGGGFGLGNYFGTSPVYCTGHISYSKIGKTALQYMSYVY